MVSFKRSIPRISTAALLLGGCGDAGDPSTSDPRYMSIAVDQCQFFLECDAETFNSYYASLDECYLESAEEFELDILSHYGEYGTECVDAVLDYYECYVREAGPMCFSEEEPEACYDLMVVTVDLCGLT